LQENNKNILEKSDLIKEAIRESFHLIELEKNDFLKNEMDTISRGSCDVEMLKNVFNSIVKENLKSKTWIAKNLDSPYLKIYIDHKNDLGQFTTLINEYIKEKKITVDLSFLEKLKQSIHEIGSNYFKILIEKDLNEFFNTQDPNFISGDESLELKLYEENVVKISQLKSEIKNSDKYYKKRLLEESKINNQLIEENYDLKDKLFNARSELQLRISTYFFMDDDLFENYIIGDKLPELRQFYMILREYNLVKFNFGYFCHCLTYHTSIKNKTEFQLEISLQDSKFIKDDLGYLLYKLKINYLYESELPFLDWLTKNFMLKSSNGNPLDIQRFYNESIRSYSSPKNRPKKYQLISERLTLL